MHNTAVVRTSGSATLLGLIGEFAWPERRAAAATELARLLGGAELIVFASDPELHISLPAPGLTQVLRNAPAWRELLDASVRNGTAVGTLETADGRALESCACGLEDGTAVVLLGSADPHALESHFAPLLPLLGALLRSERQVTVDAVHIAQAAEGKERAQVLARALDGVRKRLQAALADAEQSRNAARAQAHEAELLARRLELQAEELQQQAVEMEMLNEEMEARTAEAEHAREDAERANEAKSVFLATMSHELRTPINAVIGYAQLLDMGITGPISEKQRGQLERIQSSSKHLLTLVNDVLDLAKVEAGEMIVTAKSESAADVIAEALALIEGQAASQDIAVRSDVDPDDATYFGDRDRVRQILVNLLSNAVKFTGNGGTIRVACRIHQQPAADAELRGNGPWLAIAVEDTGIGIPAEELARIFEPFIQVDSSYRRERGGTGLGLTISRQLARMMGGKLTVQSTVGVGSCFTLWLPAGTVLNPSSAC